MNMEKSKKWCLIRQKCDHPFEVFLNKGDTTIGRNRIADVVTASSICSRNHCVITLDNNDNIHITNKSSNGTYVNSTKLGDEPHKLEHNDFIGLGCEYSIFRLLSEGEDKSNYHVFRLVNKSVLENGEEMVISLITDDEEEEEEEEVQPVVENGQNINASGEIPSHNDNPVPHAAVQTPPRSPAPIHILNDDNDDDNELIYSQQVLMEIKKEVICADEIEHEDDFSIYIDDDDSCDGESNKWEERLSQNQDFVQKVNKITESVQCQKRKATKPIDAISIAPKKGRRNSISEKKSTIIKKCSTSDVKSNESTPSTSNALNGETKKIPEPFVDRFDPFARKPKTVIKPTTFEDALLKPTTTLIPKKIRIAHVPKFTDKRLPPILKLKNGSWPSEGKRKKIDLKVSFNQTPSIREYEPDDDEIGEILIASPMKPLSSAHRSHDDSLNSVENYPLHEIITDITEWKPEWLGQRNGSPPINGVNLVICPLIDKYPSFGHYKNTMIPLLKHELWSSIQAENRNRNRFEVKINTMDLVKRAERKRYVFHLQIAAENSNSRAHVGDFVVVESDGNSSFFAYVTNQRFTKSGYTKTTYLTMEVSDSVVKLKNGEATSLYITPIANIRTELKLFNAVFHLDRTPLKELVLNPSSYQEPKIFNRIQDFRCASYDKLNDEQLNILKSVINKILNKATNLSLIEGPPGTGKTRLIVSIILQILFGTEMRQKLRILVLASSNAAVDIIGRRLLHIRDKIPSHDKKKLMNIVRFGVMNSMHKDVQKIAPQNLKSSLPLSPTTQSAIKPMIDEQKRLQDQIEMLRKKENAKNTFTQDQIKNCEKRLNQVKETIERKGSEINDFNGIQDVMSNARIVCSTLSSSINLKQYIRYFDVCIIDEASQCTEPWSLVPLQYNIRSFILVGDSNQLSPVVLSSVCREKSFERSLFTRLFDIMSKNGTVTSNTFAMTTQYRMHPDICAFSNGYFYGKRLTSAPQTLANVNFPLKPYNVFSLRCLQSNQDMINYLNIGEAEFIVTMLKVMVKHAVPGAPDSKDGTFSYGIITPYAKQRAEIQHLLSKSKTLAQYDIPVNTIDSYQGQEKDIIVLCTTRTTGIGFLANPQRLNVALTRAKKCLVICGNFTSISNTGVWSELLNDARRRKKYNEIPEKYNFQTIADLLIVKKTKPANSGKPTRI